VFAPNYQFLMVDKQYTVLDLFEIFTG